MPLLKLFPPMLPTQIFLVQYVAGTGDILGGKETVLGKGKGFGKVKIQNKHGFYFFKKQIIKFGKNKILNLPNNSSPTTEV